MGCRTTVFLLSLVVAVAFSPSLSPAQDESQGNQRKVVSQVAPVYPELARQMHIEGTVRVEATVAPNGKVESTKVLGGSPVLVQAAESAIVRWRWEPAAEQSSEVIVLHFHEN